nr:hypothetical protein [uncultured Neisseria sp.]
MQVTTGVCSSLRAVVSAMSVPKILSSIGQSLMSVNALPSSRPSADSLPVSSGVGPFSFSGAESSARRANSSLAAPPPTSVARLSFSSSSSRWRRARPVCRVSTRRPRAMVKRAPRSGSARAYMMRALASVLPQPVLARLTPKKPCLAEAV